MTQLWVKPGVQFDNTEWFELFVCLLMISDVCKYTYTIRFS
jgi:hypothetical protein